MVVGLFKAKPLVDNDEFEWLLACTKWFAQEFDGFERLSKSPLILSTKAYFDVENTENHDFALAVFEQIKRHADMADWPCRLVEGEAARPDSIATAHVLRHETAPPVLGIFGHDKEGYFISYSASLVKQPHNLIATLAHELAHYLTHSAKRRPPGSPELEEHATDFAAVMLGFGTFMANSARIFEQFQNFQEMGWQTSMHGYLSEHSLVTALAIFVTITETEPSLARENLKDYLRKPFDKAMKHLGKNYPDLAVTIDAVDLADWR